MSITPFRQTDPRDPYDEWCDDEMLRVTRDYTIRRGYVVDARADPITERMCWWASPIDQHGQRIEPNNCNGAQEYGPFYSHEEAAGNVKRLQLRLGDAVLAANDLDSIA